MTDTIPREHEGDSVPSSGKRNRSGADSYINKRFLYDVVEPPKRTRHKRAESHRGRSTAALMAASTANLAGLQKGKRSSRVRVSPNDVVVPLQQSRRGRRLRPKLEFTPPGSPVDTDFMIDPLPDQSMYSHPSENPTNLVRKARSRQYSTSDSSSWRLPDLFHVDDNHLTEELDSVDYNLLCSREMASHLGCF